VSVESQEPWLDHGVWLSTRQQGIRGQPWKTWGTTNNHSRVNDLLCVRNDYYETMTLGGNHSLGNSDTNDIGANTEKPKTKSPRK